MIDIGVRGMKYVSEIFFTTDYVVEEDWLKLILEISNLNGLFRSWKIYMQIERNVIRYFVVTRRKLPSILNCSGSFLLKNIDEFKKVKAFIPFLYLVTNKEKNIIDIYDKNETKYRQNLKQVEVEIRAFKQNNYFTKTNLYFENYKGRNSL